MRIKKVETNKETIESYKDSGREWVVSLVGIENSELRFESSSYWTQRKSIDLYMELNRLEKK